MSKIYLSLTAIAALLALAAPAGAGEIVVPNAGGELVHQTLGGQPGNWIETEAADSYFYNRIDTYPDEGWANWQVTSNGGPVRGWNPGVPGVHDDMIINTPRFADVSWGGEAPEGQNVILVVNRYNDDRYDEVDMDLDGIVDTTWSGPRDFEAAVQRLEALFDPTARYDLTTEVGRLHPNGIDDDVSDGITTGWGGYGVGLMAGVTYGAGQGAVGSPLMAATGLYNGWGSGGSVLAEDVNGTAIAEDSWISTTVSYLPNPSTKAAMDALEGEQLTIRLASYEEADHSLYAFAAFDDVRLVKYLAGDANTDGDVDIWAFDGSGDAQILSSNLGTPIGATWSEGDFNGDGDVDVWELDGTGDAQLLTGNLGETDDAAPGTAMAIYDPSTGVLSFDVGSGVGVVGLMADGLDHGAVDMGSPLGNPGQNMNGILAYFNTSGLAVGMADVGAVLPTGLSVDDIAFSYTPIGGDTTPAPVTIVPEPSTIAMLLVLGTLAFFRRRRSA